MRQINWSLRFEGNKTSVLKGKMWEIKLKDSESVNTL